MTLRSSPLIGGSTEQMTLRSSPLIGGNTGHITLRSSPLIGGSTGQITLRYSPLIVRGAFEKKLVVLIKTKLESDWLPCVLMM
jgi:hypothetical protein